ncbi:Pyruvate phosphate dikinase PEP/pyruvate binding domain [Phytophthora infestans]|uniref:Pyruvate phosphate dikinase PEP/pyruvate binding domain n=1 Tax=Phytophthora infestans TaxID=4787 RepID=A0A8S9TVR2_PHYIN|nr:Pyruvate phosphate dikinase PEP/pyruvate binding domain [Phytophthora infestans]KAF4135753.1 Pyruvate phosphate dikinase PEP/pyruvate binding domain [Phytophthora infestans]
MEIDYLASQVVRAHSSTNSIKSKHTSKQATPTETSESMSQVLQHSSVFTFVKGESKGDGSMKSLLGGKGANLCQMARNGVNVPPGLTITTEVCQEFYAA